MQASTWVNGQCRQAGQLESRQPSCLNHNTARINNGLENNSSQLVSLNNGAGALAGHFRLHNGVLKQAQRQNNVLYASNALPTIGHQNYYPNSASNAFSPNYTPTVNFNKTYWQQVMPAQMTGLSVNPSAMFNSNVGYSQPQEITGLNQNTKSCTENLANPTSATTAQAVYKTQQQSMISLNQTSVQSYNYCQTSQQMGSGSGSLPSYLQAISQNRMGINITANVQSPQNTQVYTLTPVTATQLSTSSLNVAVANKQFEQNSHFISQTNDCDAADFLNLHPRLTDLLVTNNTNNVSNSMTSAPVNTHFNSHQTQEHRQEPTVRGNRNMQTAQSIIHSPNGNCSLNVPRPAVLLHSQTCLPEATNSISRSQHITAAPLQTNISANDHCASQLMKLIYQKINDVSNCNLSAPLSQAPQVVPVSQASQVNTCEAFNKIETVSLLQANSSSHTSLSRALRAVAVVLPLSQKNPPSEHSSSKSQPSPDLVSVPCFSSSKQLDNIPVLSPDRACVEEKLQHLTSDCSVSTEEATVQTPVISPPLKQMQMSVHEARPKFSKMNLTFAQLVQGIVYSKSSRQKSTSGKRKTPTKQVLCEEELSSVPTTEWTLDKLLNMIQEMQCKENEQSSENNHKNSDHSQLEVEKHIIDKFWDGDSSAPKNLFKTGSYDKLINDIRKFCTKVSLDTVVMSQMTSQNKSTRYHVLQHDEVYKENNTYTSSWLNINSKLDDIEKEFGFPWFFKYSQEYDNSMNEETSCKMEDKCQMGLKPIHQEPEKTITKGDPLKYCSSRPCVDSNIIGTENHNGHNSNSQTAIKPFHSEPETPMMCEETNLSLNESISQPSDPSYSFTIEVLPPEEAKVIFEQIDCSSPQVVNSVSAATVSSVHNDQQNDSNREACQTAAIELVCCIEKWKENVFGLSSESKCKCNELRHDKDKQAQSENKKDCDWPMEVLTVDLTEDDNSTPIFALKEVDDRQENNCSNDSNVIVLSEGNEYQVSNHEKEFQQNLPKSTESHQVASTDETASVALQVNGSDGAICENMLELEDVCRIQPGENCTGTQKTKEAETPKTETPAPSASISPDEEVEDNTKVDNHDLLLPLTSKKLKRMSHLKSQTHLESFSKSKNKASKKSVELALFGSTQETCSSVSNRRSNFQSPLHMCDETQPPPRRISVDVTPLKKAEAEQSGSNISVKRRIHESWRKSFPPITIKLKRKLKHFSILSANSANPVTPIKLKDLQVNAKRKITHFGDSRCHKKMRTHSPGKSESSVNAQVLKKPADREVWTLQDNVLKFDVLPNTFTFKEGSNNGETVADSTTDEKTVPACTEDKQPIIKTKGTWCEESSDKSSPQQPAHAPETSSLFQEFQRRYKRSRMATDE